MKFHSQNFQHKWCQMQSDAFEKNSLPLSNINGCQLRGVELWLQEQWKQRNLNKS